MNEKRYITVAGIVRRLQMLSFETAAYSLFSISNIVFIVIVKKFLWVIGLYFCIIMINGLSLIILLSKSGITYNKSSIAQASISYPEYVNFFKYAKVFKIVFDITGILFAVIWFIIWNNNFVYFINLDYISILLELVLSILVFALFNICINNFILILALSCIISKKKRTE